MHIQKSIYSTPVDLPKTQAFSTSLPNSIYHSSPWQADKTATQQWMPPMLPPDQLAIKFSQVSGIVQPQSSPSLAIQPLQVPVQIPFSQNTGLLSPSELFKVDDHHVHSEVITKQELTTPFTKIQDLTQAPTISLRPVVRPTNLLPLPLPNIPVPETRPDYVSLDPHEIVDTGLKDVRGRPIEVTREAAQGLSEILDIAKSRGIRVEVTSSHRTVEKQSQLWEQALRKYGSASKARKWVAPPGKSRHNYGKAIDMHMYKGKSKIKQSEFDEIIAKAGMYRPMSWEGWHIEPLSTKGERSGHSHKH